MFKIRPRRRKAVSATRLSTSNVNRQKAPFHSVGTLYGGISAVYLNPMVVFIPSALCGGENCCVTFKILPLARQAPALVCLRFLICTVAVPSFCCQFLATLLLSRGGVHSRVVYFVASLRYRYNLCSTLHRTTY